MRIPLLPSLLAVAIAGGTLAAQSAQAPTPATTDADQSVESPPVTFSLQIDYVEVDVSVTDEAGNPVLDLDREDFEILEDGVPQQVELFSIVNVPITPSEQPIFSDRPDTPIEPDVRTNLEFDGRVYVLMLDDLHTDPRRSHLVKGAAMEFVEQHLAANDLAAVAYSSGRSNAGQEFTNNKRLLTESIDNFVGRRVRSAMLGRLDDYRNQAMAGREAEVEQPEAFMDPNRFQRAYNARAAMNGLANIAQLLEGVRGRRKALLYFSEGIDFNIRNMFGPNSSSAVLDSVRAATTTATRANAVIYSIDPGGLPVSNIPIEMDGMLPIEPSLDFTEGAIRDELQMAQDSLRILADETGGYAALNSNDFTDAFDRIVRENSSYYLLGYYPTDTEQSDRFRQLDVRVTRPGLEVRARRGYVASGDEPVVRDANALGGTSPALADALDSPLPEAAFPMAVSAAVFKGEAPEASVIITVEVNGTHFDFVEQNGELTDSLELTVLAIDSSGEIQAGDRRDFEMALQPETRQAVEALGLRLDTRITLEPGRYQLRVGVRALQTGSLGTVYYDLEVPDFSDEPFSMSDLVISSNLAAMIPSAQSDEQLAQVLPTPATTQRLFTSADTLRVFAEVYDNQVQTPHEVDISTTLRAVDSQVVFRAEEQRSTDELQGTSGGYGHIVEIPLAEVAPGDYLLRVDARSRLGETEAVAREILVHVVPPPRLPTEAAAAPASPLQVVNVVGGVLSSGDEARTVVARSDAEWQAVWSSLGVRGNMPQVTFENTMIVAVFLGTRPSAGYTVDVVNAVLDGDVLVVQYAERQPPAGTATAGVMTTPYTVAGVPMFTGEVRFERVEAVSP